MQVVLHRARRSREMGQIRWRCPERGIVESASPTRAEQPAEPSVPDVFCQKGRNDMLRFHTLQLTRLPRPPIFHKGDAVSLAKGTYQGTRGVFLRLKIDDLSWADVLERNEAIRSHPVEWLEHTPS